MDPLPTGLLALPGPGERTVAALDRKLALLALRALLTAPLPPGARAVERLRPWLAARLGDAGDALARAALSPEVLTPLLLLHGGAGDAGALAGAAAPALLLAFARGGGGGAREAALWDAPAPGPLWGELRLPDCAGIVVTGDRAEIKVSGQILDAARAEGVRVLHPIGGGASLALCDPNPLAMVEDHPDKAGNAIDLGGRSPEDWVSALRAALALIRVGLPGWSAELDESLRRVVPVGYEPERHLSASYREAPAQIYLTLHPDPLTMAEAVVHEVQHGKLNRLSFFDPILENGRSTWTTSPVRPDLRPLLGVLLAAHAFVPVAALHLGLIRADHPITRSERFLERRAEVWSLNEEALAVVRSLGSPTPTGRRVLAALEALHAVTRLA